MHNFLHIFFAKIFFKDRDSFKFTGGLDSVEYGNFLSENMVP